MNYIRTIFFGSTSDSVKIAKHLLTMNHEPLTINLIAVVTQPPRPVGKKQILTPTSVEVWAKEHKIPVLSFPNSPDRPYLYANEQTVIDALQPLKADLIISACYGQKIPSATIKSAKYGGLNVHPSLLPRWRGADPVPWAILNGDRQTGVTILTLEEKFDAGKIIAQKKIPITDKDFSDPLRTRLFSIGADLLLGVLPDYVSGKITGSPQQFNNLAMKQFPYARRLTRDDGFVPWKLLEAAMKGDQIFPSAIQQFSNLAIIKTLLEQAKSELSAGNLSRTIYNAFRAFSPWPGLWTKVIINGEEKRLKILSCHLSSNNLTIQQCNNLILDSVQLEGKKPVSFKEFANAYLPMI